MKHLKKFEGFLNESTLNPIAQENSVKIKNAISPENKDTLDRMMRGVSGSDLWDVLEEFSKIENDPEQIYSASHHIFAAAIPGGLKPFFIKTPDGEVKRNPTNDDSTIRALRNSRFVEISKKAMEDMGIDQFSFRNKLL